MARYYPDRAQRNNVEGSTSLKCLVTSKGQLVNCEVLSETPSDMGFGAASQQMAKIFRLKPMTKDGVAVEGGIYTFRITWRLPKE